MNKSEKIINWLKQYSKKSNTDGYVVGVSGGVDSALTSTLCCMTGLKVFLLCLPINQTKDQIIRSKMHIEWLKQKFNNVNSMEVDLTDTFNCLNKLIQMNKLAEANSKSRLRMIALYSIANTNNLLVAGTGNKVEDYGIGFFTKYGDGGVDISPIADLLKSEVRQMCRDLGVLQELSEAVATDGLWEDNRTDEQQIGASYEELEWALKYYDNYGNIYENLLPRQKEILKIYTTRHLLNKHKLEMPPICYMEQNNE